MQELDVAIVGVGPWGLCVLERLLSTFAQLPPANRSLHIHCFEPKEPGTGVHVTSEPNFLLLNTVAGQVSLFAAADRDGLTSRYRGMSFLEWVHDQDCSLPVEAAPPDCERTAIGEGDFLPRALFGRYAKWCFSRLLDCCPEGTRVSLHAEGVERIQTLPSGLEQLHTTTGRTVAVQHVFLTTGHTPPISDERMVSAYPASGLDQISGNSVVAVTGMGLVAVDAVTTLTYGRGGRFSRATNGRLVYHASGEEPRIRLLSRTGLCFQCRPSSTLDSSGAYAPGVFTREAIANLRKRRCREVGSRQLDFERDVGPLLWAELRIHYQSERERVERGNAAANDLRSSLIAAWHEGGFDAAIGRLPQFDPQFECYRPDLDRCHDSAAYQAAIQQALEGDVSDCREGEARAPRKAAFELFRVLRDVIRCAVDDSGLTDESALEFRRRFAGAVNRVAVGPPLQRGEELLALIEAGIVTIPFGRRPSLRFVEPSRSWQISSTRLERPHVENVDGVIAGHLGMPDVSNTTSPLLRSLCQQGRLRPYSDGASCGIDLDVRHHPVGRGGRASETLWVLGPLTEGPRYFTNYLPSPKSRFRAFEEAESCARSIFASVGWS